MTVFGLHRHIQPPEAEVHGRGAYVEVPDPWDAKSTIRAVVSVRAATGKD